MDKSGIFDNVLLIVGKGTSVAYFGGEGQAIVLIIARCLLYLRLD